MEINESIKRTIDYSNKYDCKPTIDDLAFRFIATNYYPTEDIIKNLNLINYKSDEKSLHKKKIGINKLIKINKTIIRLKKNNNILFVGVTGSVASGYPDENDDIDLLIITRKDSLWITRLQVKFYLLINKIPHSYHNKQKEEKDSLCLNMWIEEDSLKILSKKQNLRNAVDLIMIKPIINKHKTYEKFLKANDWARSYVCCGYDYLTKNINDNHYFYQKNQYISFTKLLNFVCFITQYLYMISKITNEVISLKRAYFHHN